MTEPSPQLLAMTARIRAAAQRARETPGLDIASLLPHPGPGEPRAAQVTPVRIGERPCEWIAGPGADTRVRILVLPGGAFQFGGLGSHRHFSGLLAHLSGYPVLTVDYRKAPAYPFPAALDDCAAAFSWLLHNDAAGPGAAEFVFVAGDSAGGNLALALSLRQRDARQRMPDGLVLMSPWADLTFSLDSHRTNRERDVVLGAGFGPVIDMLDVKKTSLGALAARSPYLQGHDARDPLVSPLFADFQGMPPMLCLAAEDEMLLDDSRRVCARASEAGVPVRLDVRPHVFHAWPVHGEGFPEAREAVHRISESLKTTVAARRAASRMAVQQDLSDYISENARETPDKPAVRDGSRTLSWRAFDDLIQQIAKAITAWGVRSGENIVTVAGLSIEHLAVFCAIERAGACFTPLSAAAGPSVVTAMMQDAGARLAFLDSASMAATAEAKDEVKCVAIDCAVDGLETLRVFLTRYAADPGLPVLSPSLPFNLIYSSGTTGVPKGILHSRAMRFAEFSRATALGFSSRSVTLVSTPLYSNTTMAALLPTLALGGTLVLLPKFSAEAFLDLAARCAVTHAMLVPVQIARILDHPGFGAFDLSSFELKMSTSAPLPAERKREMITRWPGGFIEFYGMTEGGVTCVLDARAYPGKLHTVGLPAPGCRLRIVDDTGTTLPPGQVGEIVGRSDVMMEGYFQRADATAEASIYDADGSRWHRSGDYGRLDEDGFVQLLDRKKDMIISGGFNVYAVDLEAVIGRHPSVRDVAVIGIPSERWGESPLALVVAHDGEVIDCEALCAWANAQLGKPQRLAGVEVRPDLPRNPIGKVLKRELRAPYWAKTDGDVTATHSRAG